MARRQRTRSCKAGRGLAAAHRAGIVHRDFKPHNVLVGDDGAIKVLDFGLARAVEHAGSEELSATPESGAYNQDGNSLLDVPLTRTGAIMGTPAYMAPEQHQGLPATALSDQFSFCVSLHEGLYGSHPFDCSTLGALIAGVTMGRVQEPASSSRVPGWLRRVVLRGLAVEPDKRWPSMTAVLAELARDPAQTRKRWFASTALAGFVGAGSFGAAALLPSAAALCQGIDAELGGVWDRHPCAGRRGRDLRHRPRVRGRDLGPRAARPRRLRAGVAGDAHGGLRDPQQRAPVGPAVRPAQRLSRSATRQPRRARRHPRQR